MMPLLLAFIVLPLIEITLFIQIGGVIGLWPTLATVIGTAMLGSWLLRRQGALALRELQQSFAEVRDPTAPLAHGGLILVGAVLLISPGFLTDAAGLALLVPHVRQLVMRGLAGRMRVMRSGFDPRSEPMPHRYGRGAVIDAEYVEETGSGGPARPSGSDAARPSGWTRGPDAH